MSCTDVQTIQAGNGSKTQFSFDFPYIFKSEIHVYFWNVTTKEYDEKLTTDGTYPWQITDANPTIVEFTSTAPPTPTAPTDPGEPTVDNVKIRRITKVDDIRALFNPGSAIRSDDLNRNFEQLRYAIQESGCQGIPDDVDAYLKTYYWNKFDDVVYAADTWPTDASADQKIATIASMDQRFQDETTETFTKAELAAASDVLPDNDTAVTTTGTVKDYVDHVVETDILVDGTGLNKTGASGQVTIGIAAGSVDLDRIKAADIITSGEANPNNDTTIATTAKIDDMIDAAVTGDIAGSDGVSITNDGDGTITVGLSAGSVDFDRIKAADIITEAEQNTSAAGTSSGNTTNVADTSVFTSSAAARRFDTLVQLGTPTGSDWETGKGWLQPNSESIFSVWNGLSWTTVSEGGGFRTQDKVIYVDKSGGVDTATGHRISNPKQTIKAAIDDINADISTSIKAGGSGYVNNTYNNVALTGGTTGTGLLANITVSGGAVTACTITSAATLQEYSIGDILSATDATLGNSGGGSGFELEVTGGGDGMTVIVAAGVYQEDPIQIKRRNVSIIGMALRSCIVHPKVATQGDHAAGNHALLQLNSGSFIQHLTLTGSKANNSGTNTLDSDLPANQGWNFAFYPGSFIVKSPYIQNCTNFSDSEIDNNNLNAHNPAGGAAGDTDSLPTGGGLLCDGNTPKSNSPLRSMVADSYTHVGLNGPGILCTNNGYAQCTSSYAFFNKYHIKCLNGGQANLAASTTDFGDKALVADGKSTTAIFTANTTADANVAIGAFALNDNTTGVYNVAIGFQAAYNGHDHNHITAVGYKALYTSGTSASHNTAIGAFALTSADGSGEYNTAVGSKALMDQTTADLNTAVGHFAGTNITTGGKNTCIGAKAAETLTTGADNVFVGHQCGFDATTGNDNTAIGEMCLANMTSASNNCAMGHNAGSALTTGGQNNLIGENAGDTITDGQHNTCVGYFADVSASGGTYQMVFGDATGQGDNTFKVRADSGSYNTQNSANWSTTSDRRIKKNIVDNTVGLDKINQLRVRNFEYRTEDEIDYTEFDDGVNRKSIPIDKKGVQLGVIAQEIEEVLPDTVETMSTGVKIVNPDNLTWHLVNAIKELSAKVEELESKLNN